MWILSNAINMLYSLTLFLALVRQLTFCSKCVEIVWFTVVGIMSYIVGNKIIKFCNEFSDTSVAHSPHFDWVVAHVGSCFPHTVITRVLSCGLKDFSQHGSADQSVKVLYWRKQ